MVLNDLQLVQWLKLGRIDGIGPIKLQKLVEIFGSVEKVYNASPQELLDTRIFKNEMLIQLTRFKNESEVNYLASIHECQATGIQIVTLTDSDYPLKLKRMPYPPLTLYLWGDVSLLQSRKIAVVGTRHPSDEAAKFAFDFSKFFADIGLTVISGGAEGIDTVAHEGALSSESGKTICVCPTGFFHPFPLQNVPLFEKIRKSNGLLISEHLPKFTGSRFSFIQRNRITSGLSDALLVCASAEKGGSMVQTRIAKEQCIPVFCPALEMNIQPNIGIANAIKDFGAQEIHTPQEFLSKLRIRAKSLDSYLEQTA
jgi:DNA processing protein